MRIDLTIIITISLIISLEYSKLYISFFLNQSNLNFTRK